MRYKAIDVRAAPLHTGEVAGSIPAAPTIFREFAGGSRQNVTQNTPLRSPWTLFPACIAQSLCHAGFLGGARNHLAKSSRNGAGSTKAPPRAFMG